MPFKMRLQVLLRGLPKLLAAILVAGIAGIGLGVGLSALAGGGSDSGSANSDDLAPVATTTTPTTTSRTTTTTTTTQSTPGASAVRVQVISAVLQRAVSPSGRRRNRARVAVHVRVMNNGTRTIANADPVLVSTERVRPDRRALTSGSLLRPIPPDLLAGGTLRFETAGAVSERLATTRRAQLRIAGKTVALKLRVGGPPRSRARGG